MAERQASCFPYYNKISAAGEMLYFSLLHLYGTNDDWKKGRHNEKTLGVILSEYEESIPVVRKTVRHHQGSV